MVPSDSKFSAIDLDGTSVKVPLKGSEIVGSNFGYNPGEIEMNQGLRNLFSIKSVGENFKGDTRSSKYNAAATEDAVDFTIDFDANTGITIKTTQTTANNRPAVYEATITMDQLKSAGDVLMVNTAASPLDSTDSFVVSFPSLSTLRSSLEEVVANATANGNTATLTHNGTNMTDATTFSFAFTDGIEHMKESEPARDLGFGQSAFRLSGGTEGGEQTVANLTSISINEGGHLVGVHDIYGIVDLGAISLATFANPAGLQKVGNSYFTTSLNSGDPVIVEAGTQGTGQIMASTLESSNVDLSSEFSDMIMTQRGFQASSRVITVSDTMLEELINLKR
jgi:flagellar hook protein FlgE